MIYGKIWKYETELLLETLFFVQLSLKQWIKLDLTAHITLRIKNLYIINPWIMNILYTHKHI